MNPDPLQRLERRTFLLNFLVGQIKKSFQGPFALPLNKALVEV